MLKAVLKFHRQIRELNFPYFGNHSRGTPVYPVPAQCHPAGQSGRGSPRLVPPISTDDFARPDRVSPVAQHDAVAADLKLPRSVQRQRLPCFWIHNFCLQWKRRVTWEGMSEPDLMARTCSSTRQGGWAKVFRGYGAGGEGHGHLCVGSDVSHSLCFSGDGVIR